MECAGLRQDAHNDRIPLVTSMPLYRLPGWLWRASEEDVSYSLTLVIVQARENSEQVHRSYERPLVTNRVRRARVDELRGVELRLVVRPRGRVGIQEDREIRSPEMHTKPFR